MKFKHHYVLQCIHNTPLGTNTNSILRSHYVLSACTAAGTECMTADANSECRLTGCKCKCRDGYTMGGTSNKCAPSKFCAVLCVSFCTGHLVMVPLNLTCLH